MANQACSVVEEMKSCDHHSLDFFSARKSDKADLWHFLLLFVHPFNLLSWISVHRCCKALLLSPFSYSIRLFSEN